MDSVGLFDKWSWEEEDSGAQQGTAVSVTWGWKGFGPSRKQAGSCGRSEESEREHAQRGREGEKRAQ